MPLLNGLLDTNALPVIYEVVAGHENFDFACRPMKPFEKKNQLLTIQ
jgi:hypothetical protein